MTDKLNVKRIAATTFIVLLAAAVILTIYFSTKKKRTYGGTFIFYGHTEPYTNNLTA